MDVQDFAEALRAHALSLPEAHEELPWDHPVIKVRKKVFVFLGNPSDGEFGFSLKLQESHEEAMATPGASPTGYGLGKSGWVSLEVTPATLPDLDVVKAWIEESYRLVAPKTLGRKLLG